jgi:23S rRNA (guanosine2251-2'-O)-methyltransferase
MVAQGTRPYGPLAEAIQLAQTARIPVQYVPREALDRACGSPHHQGIAAVASAYRYATVDDILDVAKQKGEMPLILALDSLQDPQNLGSLLRTAEAVGSHGVILPRHRAAGVTAAVAKVSSGAIEHMKTAQVTNLARTLEELKKQNLWVVGVDMDGKQDYDQADLKMPLVLVVGGEGQGIGRLVKQKCDLIVRLPMRGRVASLNAAVAGSIVLYEAWRQRERQRGSANMRH